MKIGKWTRLLLLGAPILAGCSGFWQKPTSSSGSGGCTTNCSTATSGDFYILNSGSPAQIAGYSIVSGTLTAIGSGSVTLTGNANAIAMGHDGGYLYASTSEGVFLYPIDSGGTLGTGASVDSTEAPSSLQVDPTGAWLIEAVQVGNEALVNAIPIDSTGTPTSSQPYAQTYASQAAAVSLRPGQLAISGDDKYIFISGSAAGTLVVPFNASAASGTSPLGNNAFFVGPLHGGSDLSVAVDPSTAPQVFYIGETQANSAGNSGALRVLNYSQLASQQFSDVANSPIATGTLAPYFVLPASGGTYVYVANGAASNAGTVGSFALTNTGSSSAPVYSIAAVSTATAGILPAGLAVDSTGSYLLEVNQNGSPDFESFSFDSNTPGQMDIQITSNATGTTPIAVVAAP